MMQKKILWQLVDNDGIIKGEFKTETDATMARYFYEPGHKVKAVEVMVPVKEKKVPPQ